MDLQKTCCDIRVDVIKMAEHSAHVAPALSCVDILATLYLDVFPGLPKGDWRFVLSKGHGCMALYAVLAHAGVLDRDALPTYGQDDSILAEHPLAGKVPGVEFATGTLGHGLAFAAGYAKAFKLQGGNARVFVLLGDGECDEGAVWEAAAAARAHGLDNLTAVVDGNGFQACGKCRDISRDVELTRCWEGFGWDVQHVNGHDTAAMAEAFKKPNLDGTPRMIYCRTIKGKGISFMEHNLEWHYRPVRGDERDSALEQLDDA